MHVEIRNEARLDIIDAALFYEQQREMLGDRFTDVIFEHLQQLEHQGGIHATSFGMFRKLVTPFPFAIYYQVADSVVDVVAVLNCRRKPESIAGTLDSRLPNTG